MNGRTCSPCCAAYCRPNRTPGICAPTRTRAVWATKDPELTSTAAHEIAAVDGVAVELYSTIVGPQATGQVPVPPWFDRSHSAGESRHRYVEVITGPVRFGLDLDPVTLPNGTRLPLNTHRLVIEGPSLRREWLIHDSPMDNALRQSLDVLLTDPGPPGPDLGTVVRIGRLAAAVGSARHPSPVTAPSAAPSARM